jgi:hypothetical protein
MKPQDEKSRMFEYEQYWMILLRRFHHGLIATLVGVNIIGRTDAARGTRKSPGAFQ